MYPDLVPDSNDPNERRRLLAMAGGMTAIPTSQPVTTPISPAQQKLKPITTDAIPASDATRLQPVTPKTALPTEDPKAAIGGSSDLQGRLQHLRDMDANPWGSENNHPGFGGKLAHVAAKVGNIAGDIIAPNVMARIPGTELNRKTQEEQLQGQIGQAQTRETAAAGEKVHERQATTEEQKEASEEPLREAQTKALGERDSEALAKLGMMRDKEGNLTSDPTSPIYQKQQLAQDAVKNVMDLRNAQRELAEARTEVELAKNDPNSPAFKIAQQRLAMAQYAHEIAQKNLGLHQEQFQNKLQEQELVKPSGQSQSRGSAAQAVLDVIPDLKGLVEKNRAQMGPLIGRLNKGEITIGNLPPDMARLVSSMESFYALQPAVHGFKNFEVVKDFKTAMGTLERDPDSFIAGMEGLMPTLNAVAKEGKTSHKRIVEGRDTPAAGGGGAFQVPQGAPEAPKEDGHKLKQGGKVVAVSKGGQWQQP